MRGGGFERHLPSLPRPRGHVHFLKRQGHQARRYVLAGRDDGIIFARIVHRRGFIDIADKLVGFARHGRDHDNHVVAIGHFTSHALCSPFDFIECGDRGAAEFHHENWHFGLISPV